MNQPAQKETTAVTIKNASIADIQNRTTAIVNAALPLVKHLIPNPEMQLANFAVYLHQNDDLARCDKTSIQGAILKCCQLGLMPGGAFNHVYWIPYENKRKGITEVNVEPSYFGLRFLAEKCGYVNWKHAAIYDGDNFEYEDSFDSTSFSHKVKLGSNRGKIIASFAGCEDLNTTIKNAQGKDAYVRKLKVLTLEEIEVAKNAAKQKFVWNAHYAAMAMKTAIRRLCKDLNLDRNTSEEVKNLVDAIDIESTEIQDNAKLAIEATGEETPKAHEPITAAPNMFDKTKALLSDAIKNGFDCKEVFGANATTLLADCKSDSDCITIIEAINKAGK